MAIRDHYPSYIQNLDINTKLKLDLDIQNADGKIIKLRRIVISAISKVA